MAQTLQHYCEILHYDTEDPIEITLRGQDNGRESANVFATTDISTIETLASLIKSRSRRTVDLSLIELTSCRDVFNSLMTFMVGSTSIKSLTVDGSFLDDEVLSYLLPVLHFNVDMINLTITNAAITADGMRMLRTFISGCSLSKFKFSPLQWTDDIASELAEALLGRKNDLESLGVTGGLSSSGVALISDVIINRSVDLSDNIFGDAGAEVIASTLLHTWSNICFLNISRSLIGDDAVRVIAEALTVNRHLKDIDFSYNSAITDKGGKDILRTVYNTESFSTLMNSNHVLASCCFNGCQLTKKLKRRIGYFCGVKMNDDDSREGRLIQRKVIAFICEKRDGRDLASFDLKMMPFVLFLIARKCDLSTFHSFMTTWNFPTLFANPPPEKIIKHLREQLDCFQNERLWIIQENEILKRTLIQKDHEIEKLKNSIIQSPDKRQKLHNN